MVVSMLYDPAKGDNVDHPCLSHIYGSFSEALKESRSANEELGGGVEELAYVKAVRPEWYREHLPEILRETAYVFSLRLRACRNGNRGAVSWYRLGYMTREQTERSMAIADEEQKKGRKARKAR